MHAHDEKEVGNLERRPNRRPRGLWLQSNSSRRTTRLNSLNELYGFADDFGVKCDVVRTRREKWIYEVTRVRNHQVNINPYAGRDPSNGGAHCGPHRKIGDEVPVHHIDMDVVGTGTDDGTNIFAQISEIRREDRRANEWTEPSGELASKERSPRSHTLQGVPAGTVSGFS